VICGDFNGDLSMWENNTQPNKAGKSIYEAILNSYDTCLLTPQDLGTPTSINMVSSRCEKQRTYFGQSGANIPFSFLCL
jgi:hypothetical protein